MARSRKSFAAPLAGCVLTALAFTAATGPLAGAAYPPAPGGGAGSGGVESVEDGPGSGLPRTGSNTASTIQLASVLMAAGAGVLVVQAVRRRNEVKTEV